eukprot:superscaffoldBa00007268_g22376
MMLPAEQDNTFSHQPTFTETPFHRKMAFEQRAIFPHANGLASPSQPRKHNLPAPRQQPTPPLESGYLNKLASAPARSTMHSGEMQNVQVSRIRHGYLFPPPVYNRLLVLGCFPAAPPLQQHTSCATAAAAAARRAERIRTAARVHASSCAG